MDHVALKALYNLAIAARGVWWRTARPRLIGVRVLVIRDDQVLLVRHRGGALPWSLPGGGVHKRETLAEAAVRECAEEGGVAIEIERVHGVFVNFPFGASDYITVFVASAVNTPSLGLSLEIAEARFFAMDALPLAIQPGSVQRIVEFQAGQTGLSGQW